jgi:hypothetical protein
MLKTAFNYTKQPGKSRSQLGLAQLLIGLGESHCLFFPFFTLFFSFFCWKKQKTEEQIL